MQDLALSAYEALRAGAQVLEADKHGDKVLRLADGNFLKLFRRKRLISSALLYPYAQRFADNTATLRRLAIPCPEIIAVYRIAEIARDAVHYQPLPGDTLRHLLPTLQGDEHDACILQLGEFIAELHDKGIYFRSLHLGNVVHTDNGELGLIDIADLQNRSRSLSLALRKRNFRHMLRYQKDVQLLTSAGIEQLFGRYNQCAARPVDHTELG